MPGIGVMCSTCDISRNSLPFDVVFKGKTAVTPICISTGPYPS